MQKLDGIIFDLDSTLVNVDLDFNKIRDALGIPQPHPILEWLDKLDDLEKKKQLEEELFQFELKAAQDHKKIEGVKEALEHFHSNNIKMAVLTRNCKEVALLELEDIEHFFNPIFSREDHEKCKPHPDGILDACQRWDVNPANTIMMGDYLYDLEAGKNAGSKTIWFDNPKYDERDFTKHADLSFSCWINFLENLEENLNKLGFKAWP
jgi:HAD superfamily hydrolase (TIGR01549 family)